MDQIETVFVGNRPLPFDLARGIFGSMLKMSQHRVESWHGDLFHDATILHGFSDRMKHGTVVLWSVGDCGTHLDVNLEGVEEGYEPPWIKANSYRTYIHFRFEIMNRAESAEPPTYNWWEVHARVTEYPLVPIRAQVGA